MVDLNRLRARQRVGADTRTAASPGNDGLLLALEPTPARVDGGVVLRPREEIFPATAAAAINRPQLTGSISDPPAARETVYAALVAEAAEVAGGTQEDHRADVVAYNGFGVVEVGEPPRADLLITADTAGVLASLPEAPALGVFEGTLVEPALRRGRGRPRKPRAVVPEPSADVARTEALATAVQQFADAANTLVSALNAELRRLGVGVGS